MSPRIQKPHKMHKNLDYNHPENGSDFLVEDSYDILYEEDFKVKPFYAVLRTNYNKSQILVSLFNTFVLNGGFVIMIEYMLKNENTDVVANLLWGLSGVIYLIPRMAVNSILKPLLQALRFWTMSNIKVFTAKHY